MVPNSLKYILLKMKKNKVSQSSLTCIIVAHSNYVFLTYYLFYLFILLIVSSN